MVNLQETLLITGANGFLGSWIRKIAPQYYPIATILAPTHHELDIADKLATLAYFSKTKPTFVIHAAAKVGGINYNQLYPADIFDINVRMAVNVFTASVTAKVQKLTNICSACAYPGEASGDLKEQDFLSGPMHPSVEVYGFSKRALFLGGRAYYKQYDLASISLVLTNLYGAGDTFDFDRAHVVSALIRRFFEAVRTNAPSVTCWGTGKAIRDFLHAEDASNAILRASQMYNDYQEILNIGTGIDTSIKELVDLIVELTGYRGAVQWDATKPDGAIRKVLDISKMEKILNWKPSISLREGLEKTIKWFSENYEEAIKR